MQFYVIYEDIFKAQSVLAVDADNMDDACAIVCSRSDVSKIRKICTSPPDGSNGLEEVCL